MTSISSSRKLVLTVSQLSILFLAFSLVSLAQSTTANIVGTATDSSGAVVPGVAVTATNLATGVANTSVTEANGAFFLRLLPPGRYTVKAELRGFKTWVLSEVTLAVGDDLRLEPRLELGQMVQTLEVTAAQPALQTEASNVAGLIGTQAVQSLPAASDNFVNLLVLTPGAGSDQVRSTIGTVTDHRPATAITINGFTGGSNNWLLDGMDDNERFDAVVIVRPALDDIQEIRVETNKYSAEFGRTSGGVINVITKSGTNQFHGSLFESLHNDDLDARNLFATVGVVPKPAWKENIFGGSFGGPIKKNKTFFFGDYQGSRVRYGQVSTVAVPTDANRAGLFTGVIYNPLTTRRDPAHPGQFLRDPFPSVNGVTNISNYINPVSKNVLALWPEPNGGTAASPTWTQAPERIQRDDRFDLRLDHRIGTSDSIFARYSFDDCYTYLPSQLPVVNGINPGGGTQPGPDYVLGQVFGISYVHTFSPSVVLEVRPGFNRYSTSVLPPNWGLNPSAKLGLVGVNQDLYSSGLATFNGFSPAPIGDASFVPTIDTNNIYQIYGILSYVRSNHSIRVGSEYHIRQVAMFQSSAQTPIFSFDNTATYNPETGSGGNAFATFLLGYPTQTQLNAYLVHPFYSFHEVGWFVQDDWHAAKWLTLNIGLRWDYYSPITERHNDISNIDLVTNTVLIAGQNGVSKSAGIQPDFRDYQPRVGFAATVARGTVFRGGYGISFVPNSLNTPLALRNPPFVDLISEAYNLPAYLVNPVPTRSLSTPFPPLSPASTSPQLITGNLAPVALNEPTPYTQEINGTLQRELPAGFVLSAGYVGSLARKIKGTVNVNQLNPGETVRPYASIFPNVGNGSITVTADRFSINYNSLQTDLERRFKNGFQLSSNFAWAHLITTEDAQCRACTERANTGLGKNYRFTVSGTYLLPFLKNSTGFVHGVATGWQLNGDLITHTGAWLTVSNLNTRTGFVSTSLTGGGGGIADRPNLISYPNDGPQTVQQWFNTAAFVGQTLGTYGNAGGGVVQGPGLTTVDFALAKSFAVREGTDLRFRVEAFNVLNHPNLGNPNVSLGSSLFGQITSALDPRTFQIALRLTF